MRKIIWVFIAASFIIFTDLASAQDDGFKAANDIATNYFTIYYNTNAEIEQFNRNVYIPPSRRVLYGKNAGIDDVDMLFLWVSDILDMSYYNFKGKIKICQDQNHLSQIYKNLFNSDLNSSSFYVYNLRAIYVDIEKMDMGVLGHEMAHAIVCNYFPIVPPVKMQEILSGYVEYQLKKTLK